MVKPREETWDKVGAALSLVCLAHCALLPLLATMLPFLGAHAHHHNHGAVHLGILILALPVGFLALIPGYKKHRIRWIPALGFAGILGLLAAPMLHSFHLPSLETLWAFLCSSALIVAHLSNWHHCRTKCHGECHH